MLHLLCDISLINLTHAQLRFMQLLCLAALSVLQYRHDVLTQRSRQLTQCRTVRFLTLQTFYLFLLLSLLPPHSLSFHMCSTVVEEAGGLCVSVLIRAGSTHTHAHMHARTHTHQQCRVDSNCVEDLVCLLCSLSTAVHQPHPP